MRSYALLLSILLAGAQAQGTARQQFAATCPNKDGQTEEILPGYVVKYTCDHWKSGINHEGVGSLQDCARLCQDEPGCTGSSWSAKKVCVLSSGGALNSMDKVLYMERIEDSNPFQEGNNPFEGDDCEEDLEDCREEKEILTSQLSACNSQLAAAQVPLRCPASNGKTTFVQGKSWKIHCSRDATCLGASHNIGNKNSFEECVRACADRDGCSFASYKPSTKACWGSKSDQQFSDCTLGNDALYDTVRLV